MELKNELDDKLDDELDDKLDNKPELRFVCDFWLTPVSTLNDLVLISSNFSENLTKIRAKIWMAKAWVICSILEFQNIKLASCYII